MNPVCEPRCILLWVLDIHLHARNVMGAIVGNSAQVLQVEEDGGRHENIGGFEDPHNRKLSALRLGIGIGETNPQYVARLYVQIICFLLRKGNRVGYGGIHQRFETALDKFKIGLVFLDILGRHLNFEIDPHHDDIVGFAVAHGPAKDANGLLRQLHLRRGRANRLPHAPGIGKDRVHHVAIADVGQGDMTVHVFDDAVEHYIGDAMRKGVGHNQDHGAECNGNAQQNIAAPLAQQVA